MKITRLALLAAVAALVVVAGCSDPVKPPVEPYTGTNGLVANPITFILPDNSVKTYENLRMDFGKSSVQFMDAIGIQRAIRLEGLTFEKRDVSVTLALPANASGPGEYVWVDGNAPTTTEAYMILERDDIFFTSLRGKTVITKFGAPGGTVEGTFSGVIRNAETLVETQIDGKFTAARLN